MVNVREELKKESTVTFRVKSWFNTFENPSLR